MLVLQNAGRSVFFLFLLVCAPLSIYCDISSQSFGYGDANSEEEENGGLNHNFIEAKSCGRLCRKYTRLNYYLNTAEFIQSFIEIPTSNVLSDSTTVSSKYLAGRAPVYNERDEKVGFCSASFLCLQNDENIISDISNYLFIDNGLIVSWFTPSTLLDLELDSILHGMVTECIVKASTKIGFNPFYGKTYNMVVSSEDQKIWFKLRRI